MRGEISGGAMVWGEPAPAPDCPRALEMCIQSKFGNEIEFLSMFNLV